MLRKLIQGCKSLVENDSEINRLFHSIFPLIFSLNSKIFDECSMSGGKRIKIKIGR